jgi:hypothetical protein
LDGDGRVRSGAAPFGGDEGVEPADLVRQRIGPVPVQLVEVGVGRGVRQPRAQPLQAVEEAGAPPVEDPQPDLGAGPGEQGEVDAEALVVGGGGRGVGEEPAQPVRPGVGQPVDDPRAAARCGGAGVGRDEAGPPHPLQAGVERAVGDRARGVRGVVEPLAQFVAVQRGVGEVAEDGEFEGPRPACRAHRHLLAPTLAACRHRPPARVVAPGGPERRGGADGAHSAQPRAHRICSPHRVRCEEHEAIGGLSANDYIALIYGHRMLPI